MSLSIPTLYFSRYFALNFPCITVYIRGVKYAAHSSDVSHTWPPQFSKGGEVMIYHMTPWRHEFDTPDLYSHWDMSWSVAIGSLITLIHESLIKICCSFYSFVVFLQWSSFTAGLYVLSVPSNQLSIFSPHKLWIAEDSTGTDCPSALPSLLNLAAKKNVKPLGLYCPSSYYPVLEAAILGQEPVKYIEERTLLIH